MEVDDNNSSQQSGGIADIASVVPSTKKIQAVTSSEQTANINVLDSPLQSPIKVVSITQEVSSQFLSVKDNASSNQVKTEIWTTIPSVAKLTPQNVIQMVSTSSSNTKESDLLTRLSAPVGTNIQMSSSMPPDSVHNYAMAVTTSASPSGSTIHHVSQTPPRPIHTQPIKTSHPPTGLLNSFNLILISVLNFMIEFGL
ncbi:hypothetical protein GQR58_006974 [Nymphon striatum]|nr:hypothetical protein GQR58_006974 [Nymphon striatum]